MAFHCNLQHLNLPETYARISLVDLYSALNTITTSLQDKLTQLDIPDSTRRWITDLLTDSLENRSPSPGPSAPVLLKLFFSFGSALCTQTAASPVNSLKTIII